MLICMCLYMQILVVWIGRFNHLAVRTHSPCSHHLHFQEIVHLPIVPAFIGGPVVAQWLRCCATNWKVAGSIPAGVSGFFMDIKFFDRTMALGSSQPLTEMSTRSISWG
jgi:hypothetical protein